MKTKNILFVMFAILAVALPCFAQGMDNIFWRAGLSDHDLPEIKAIINTIDLEERDEQGRTALMKQIEVGNLEIVKYLLEECHVDVTVTDYSGTSAFQLAEELKGTEPAYTRKVIFAFVKKAKNKKERKEFLEELGESMQFLQDPIYQK